MLFFVFEWLAFDTVALLLLAALIIFGILTPQEAFSGFANEIIVILASMFVISGALTQAGIMDWLGHAIHRVSLNSESRLIGYLIVVAAAISAFFSNTTATAVLMPAAIEASHQAKISPNRSLMPLAYGSILGGTCTLIGTSTNVVVAEAVLLPPSSLIGKTLKQLNYYRRFGAVVLAIYRRGHSYPAQIENMSLRIGDVLLLQGSLESVGKLRGNPN